MGRSEMLRINILPHPSIPLVVTEWALPLNVLLLYVCLNAHLCVADYRGQTEVNFHAILQMGSF